MCRTPTAIVQQAAAQTPTLTPNLGRRRAAGPTGPARPGAGAGDRPPVSPRRTGHGRGPGATWGDEQLDAALFAVLGEAIAQDQLVGPDNGVADLVLAGRVGDLEADAQGIGGQGLVLELWTGVGQRAVLGIVDARRRPGTLDREQYLVGHFCELGEWQHLVVAGPANWLEHIPKAMSDELAGRSQTERSRRETSSIRPRVWRNCSFSLNRAMMFLSRGWKG